MQMAKVFILYGYFGNSPMTIFAELYQYFSCEFHLNHHYSIVYTCIFKFLIIKRIFRFIFIFILIKIIYIFIILYGLIALEK